MSPGPTRVLRGATVLHLDPPRVERTQLRVVAGKIVGIGPTLELEGGEVIEELGGRWLMPGLVCAHTHLYSALACGMPMPSAAPASFADMLAQVWWKLDRALDEESVEISARVGGLQALRAGVTTLVDHHASPSFIVGSLERVDAGLDALGLRRVLCYEVSDRGGEAEARAGLDAHRALLAAEGRGVRALLVGAHANFTVSDATLRACGELARDAGVGVHIHVAEAVDDRQLTGEPLVARMRRLGALRPGSLLAHCVHLSPQELGEIADAGAWVSHQPRSNMNNAVGQAPLAAFGPDTALGTDGLGADMFAELQTGWYRGAAAGLDWPPARWLELLSAGARFASQTLGVRLGKIEVGAEADLVVLDPIPGPPLRDENLAAAMIFRLQAAAVRDVMIAGQWRLRDRAPLGLDAAGLDARAQVVSAKLWRRMADA